ncbi:hypothetical protein F5Y03DRAFT_371391 [Xylaria venustula]|nr:hypothetical protein F5Y03DRAFT_371391 [Xylaria venustula]
MCHPSLFLYILTLALTPRFSSFSLGLRTLTMTNLGPLTTTFTPQGPDCASTFLGKISDNLWLQYGVGDSPSSACYPSSFDPHQSYYYSPGICPSGYTAACTAEIFVSGNKAAQQLTCCPESYSCHSNRGTDPFACISGFKGTKTYSISTYFFERDENNSTTKIDIGTTTATWVDVFLLAYGPLVLPPGDDDTSTPSSTTTTSASGSATTSSAAPGTSNASIPTQSTIPSTTSNESTGGSSGLSRGAVAGISVGVVLAAILLVGAIAFLIVRRRKRPNSPSTAMVGSEVTSPFKPQHYQDQQYQEYQQDQQHQQHRYELSEAREAQVYELGGERE